MTPSATITPVPTEAVYDCSGILGADWKAATLNAGFGKRHMQALIDYNGYKWVIAGADFTYPHYSDVWRSLNGVDWEMVTVNAAFGERAGHAGVVYQDKMWVIAGSNNGTCKSDVWWSTDGITWTQASSSATEATGFQAIR